MGGRRPGGCWLLGGQDQPRALAPGARCAARATGGAAVRAVAGAGRGAGLLRTAQAAPEGPDPGATPASRGARDRRKLTPAGWRRVPPMDGNGRRSMAIDGAGPKGPNHRLQCVATVAVAQLVESRIVIPVVVGSSPISHPKKC